MADIGTRLAHRRRIVVAGATLALLTLLTAVPASGSALPASKGTVDVIFDSSLTDAMALLAPAFQKATGYSMLQTAGGSAADAAAIFGKTTKQDVFVSQGAASEKSLEGGKNGNWVSWYAQMGSTSLVLGYSGTNNFAKDLRTMPWYKVVGMQGFKFGRVDPASDSAGALTIDALKSAAKTERLPALAALASSKSDVYSETDLLVDLRTGQVSAAFLYGVDASASRLRTISPSTIHLATSYMISVLRATTHENAAVALVKYLLSPAAAAILKKEGVAIDASPTLAGPESAVPVALRSLIH